jgi:hypothetical protein
MHPAEAASAFVRRQQTVKARFTQDPSAAAIRSESARNTSSFIAELPPQEMTNKPRGAFL